MMLRILAVAGLAAGVWTMSVPAYAQSATPETYAQKACKSGWVWDDAQQKCVRSTRGSFSGSTS